MGFQVSVSGNVDALLKRLRSSPASVFDRPYKGYILFLAGAADQEVCKWLEKNILVLDSLTGEDVAFAVFAREFRFKIRTHPSGCSRPPRYVGSIPSEELSSGSWDVKRIVKSGRCGWVADGDEIAAVTYAVDEIAKGFGVLEKLPCVIVLDAMPEQKINAIHLSTQICEEFVNLLRKSLSKFSLMKGYCEIENSVNRILRLYEDIELVSKKEMLLTQELRNAEKSLQNLESVGPGAVANKDKTNIEQRLFEAREALLRPSLRSFRYSLHGSQNCWKEPLPGIELKTLADVIEEAECQYKMLWSIIKTIKSLNKARSAEEPNRSEKINIILKKYISKLLDINCEALGNVLQDKDLEQILKELHLRQERIINKIMSRIPSKRALIDNLECCKKKRYLREIEMAREEVKLLKGKLEALMKDQHKHVSLATQRYEEEIQKYFAGNFASFWKAVSKSLKELKLNTYSSSIKVSAAELAIKIFSPEFLYKMWQTLGA